MIIQRNLKNFLKNEFTYYKFNYSEHSKNNNKYTRKTFLIKVYQTSAFKFYNLRCEMKTLLTMVKKLIKAKE